MEMLPLSSDGINLQSSCVISKPFNQLCYNIGIVTLHDGKMNQQLFWQLAIHCNGGCSVALCIHVPQPFAGTASVVKFFVGSLVLSSLLPSKCCCGVSSAILLIIYFPQCS